MATTFSHSASSLLLEPLPDLNISVRHTTSPAVHPILFVGVLQPWANFEVEVANTYNSQTWNPRAIAAKLTGNFVAGSVDEERVFVSDERGTQGRLEGRAGTALGAVFEAQNQDLKLGSFKGAWPPYPEYKKAPDFALLSSTAIAKVVGEAKVPWIPKHDIRRTLVVFENGLEESFRNLLGQYFKPLIGGDSYSRTKKAKLRST